MPSLLTQRLLLLFASMAIFQSPSRLVGPHQTSSKNHSTVPKGSWEKAHSLQSTGYDGSAALLRVAGDVAELAYDLFDAMQRKHSPRRVRRIESN